MGFLWCETGCDLIAMMPKQNVTSCWSMRLGSGTALSGLYIFALFSAFSTSGSAVGMILILAGTAFVLPRFWADVRYEPVFWLSVLLVLVILVRSFLALQEFPELGDAKNPHWRDFVRATPLFAIPLAWWLNERPRHLKPIIITAISSVFLGIAYAGNWDLILGGHHFNRFVWGYNPNFMGLVSGAAILVIGSWILWSPRERHVFSRWILAAIPLGFLALLLFVSQSRSVWFGFLLGLLSLIVWAVANWRVTNLGWMRSSQLMIGFLSFFVLVVFLSGVWGLALGRLLEDWGVVALVLGGDAGAAAIEGGAVGWRIEMWLVGWDAFRERPWFGWGPGASQVIPGAQSMEMKLAHFHNLYLEGLLGVGVVGFTLALAIVGLLVAAAVRATRLQLLSPVAAGALMAVTILTAIALLFMIRIGQVEGRAFLRMIEMLFLLALFRVSAWRRECSVGDPAVGSMPLSRSVRHGS